MVGVVTGLVKEPNNMLCKMLDRSDYEQIVWTAATEFPGEVSTCMTDVFQPSLLPVALFIIPCFSG